MPATISQMEEKDNDATGSSCRHTLGRIRSSPSATILLSVGFASRPESHKLSVPENVVS